MNFGWLATLNTSWAFVIPSEVEESPETILNVTILPMGYEVPGIISAVPSAPI
jgi:hypothetical protein